MCRVEYLQEIDTCRVVVDVGYLESILSDLEQLQQKEPLITTFHVTVNVRRYPQISCGQPTPELVIWNEAMRSVLNQIVRFEHVTALVSPFPIDENQICSLTRLTCFKHQPRYYDMTEPFYVDEELDLLMTKKQCEALLSACPNLKTLAIELERGDMDECLFQSTSLESLEIILDDATQIFPFFSEKQCPKLDSLHVTERVPTSPVYTDTRFNNLPIVNLSRLSFFSSTANVQTLLSSLQSYGAVLKLKHLELGITSPFVFEPDYAVLSSVPNLESLSLQNASSRGLFESLQKLSHLKSLNLRTLNGGRESFIGYKLAEPLARLLPQLEELYIEQNTVQPDEIRKLITDIEVSPRLQRLSCDDFRYEEIEVAEMDKLLRTLPKLTHFQYCWHSSRSFSFVTSSTEDYGTAIYNVAFESQGWSFQRTGTMAWIAKRKE